MTASGGDGRSSGIPPAVLGISSAGVGSNPASVTTKPQEQCIDDGQWNEIQEYAHKNGKMWRSKLREEWAAGKDTLRWARNMFGPSELDKVNPDAVRYSRRRSKRRRFR